MEGVRDNERNRTIDIPPDCACIDGVKMQLKGSIDFQSMPFFG